jgi:mandelamide amidase
MTRSVADIALLDSVLAGIAYEPVEPRSVRGLRLGVPRALFYDNLDPAVVAAIDRSLKQLTLSGVVLIEADIPLVDNNALDSFTAVSGWETGAAVVAYLETSGSHITIFDILEGIASPDVKYLWDQGASGAGPTEEQYRQAMAYRENLRDSYQSYFADLGVEAIIYPTVPLPATPIGQDFFIELNGQQVPAMNTIGRNTEVTALIGAPAISIGMGQTPSGLPLGLDVAGPIGADASLLAIAAGIDSVLGPDVRPPPILPEPSY